MRTFSICTGNSRQAAVWPMSHVSYEELLTKLETPLRTSETVAQYQKMKKNEKDEAKDKGGFMAGTLKGTRRKKTEVLSRSIITLDGDKATTDFLEIYRSILQQYLSIIYTTHSHTPEKPRVRILIFLERDVTVDEYNAIARYLADELGMEMFDPVSFEVNQLMYWPTCPADGEYICEAFEGPLLDPDVFLADYPFWKDPTTLPQCPTEKKREETERKKQEDPLEKTGIVGAFCRAYSIADVMQQELADVYESTDYDDRYHFRTSDSIPGVLVYDDKFVYSHHASDPAFGKLLNAFDLVRIHKFDDEDVKKSFNDMAAYAITLDAVKQQLAEERREKAEEDFAPTEDWESKLRYQPRSSVLENSVWNEMLILNNDPDYANFAFNEMANRVQVTGPLPWDRPRDNKFWRDADTAQLKARIDVRYVPFSSRNHEVSFTKVADDRRFHPVRDYLDALPAWDGQKRIEELLIRYLSADDTEYVRTVTRKTFAAAVARILHPGVKFDCVLVLDGVQGIGKSTLFKDLVGDEYYSETLSLTDMNDKSGAEKLQGFWVMEIAELAGMKKADIEKVKAFLSTTDDKYRPSYGKTVESHPRQCIIIASVNGERGYLRDITGNRRFWVVKLNQTEQKKRWNFTQEDRDQIWAEAKYHYEHGEKLYLEGDMISAAEDAQRDAMEVDERQGMVENYLETLLPENWESMDIADRRYFLSEKDAPTSVAGTVRRDTVTNAEIWCECFGRNLAEMKPADSYAIAALMTQIDGWQRTNRSTRKRIYGKQRLYERV